MVENRSARVRKDMWRLGINGVLTQVFAAMLYSISTIGYLPSFHRFVTNPGKESLNGTDLSKVSIFAYSCLIN